MKSFARTTLLATIAAVLLWASPAMAAEIGQVKSAKGTVHIQRDGRNLPVVVGDKLQQSDTVVTGPDGSVGITFVDNTLVSAGPNSTLVIQRYAFDSTTHAGTFDARIDKGTLAIVSGKIAKQNPDAMIVRTPSAILGVRGTEFLVKAEQ